MHPSRSEQLYRLNKKVSNLCQWLFCFLAAMCVVNPTHEVFIHLALAALSAGIASISDPVFIWRILEENRIE